MLISKEETPEQVATEATWVTARPVAHVNSLPESTSEELLAELHGIVESRKGTRGAMLASSIGGTVLYVISMFTFIMQFWRSGRVLGFFPFLGVLLASLCFMILGMYGSLRIGRRFYQRRRERLHAIVPALAERGDVRLLPHLLTLMDMKYSGILMWKESRPVFLQSLETLLARITPEEFQALSRQQLWDTTMMLYFPDGRLREVTVETLIRCGDNRTIETLTKLRMLISMGPTNAKSLFYRLNPMVRFLQKEGVPMASEEARDAVERALAGLKAPVEEMRRTAQLLRASEPNAGQKARDLLRASAPSGQITPPEELVRPAAPIELPPKPSDA